MKRACTWLFVFLCLIQCTHPSKTVSIAWDPGWNSMAIDAPSVRLTGFFNDLLLEISKQYRRDFSFKVSERNWTDLKEGLVAGQYEVIAINEPQRPWEGIYVASDPLIPTGAVLVVPKRASERHLAELGGQEVGLLMDDETLTLLSQYETIYPRFYPTVSLMLEDLKEGRIAGALTPVLAANAYLEDVYALDLIIVSETLTPPAIVWLGMEESSETVQMLNRMTLELKANGTYHALLQKWGFTPPVAVR